MQITQCTAYKMKALPSQRRKMPRKGCQLDVNYVFLGRYYSGYVMDIGTHGAFVETYLSPDVGDEISLSINYQDLQQPCKINGCVVRTSTKGFGIQFNRNNPSQNERIDALVDRMRGYWI